MTEIIDAAWRSEKLEDLDIMVASKTIHNKMNTDATDEEQMQRVPILEARTWNDNGISELITPFTAEMLSSQDPLELPKISSIR
jgi:hypothetical protein